MDKKEMRKAKSKAMTAARRSKRDFKAQLRDERRAAGMKGRGRAYRQQVKDYRQTQFADDKAAAKAIKEYKY